MDVNKNLVDRIVRELNSGRSKQRVIKGLTDQGMQEKLAKELVDEISIELYAAKSKAENRAAAAGCSQAGIIFLILGIGGLILPLINLNFFVLNWVDLWGIEIGIIIKVSFIVIGCLAFLVGAGNK